MAVESGSERVRRIVNKKLDTEDILQCAVNAQVVQLPVFKRCCRQWHVSQNHPEIRIGASAILQTLSCAVHAGYVLLCVPFALQQLPCCYHSLTVCTMQEGGLEGLKLYGMVGVPGEKEEGVL